jgi:UDP-N-acetylglucosamine 1-carboxyvinyltransferase
MENFRIYPSGPLQGEVQISGAKNAVLPVMAATLLTQGESVIGNVPYLKDVKTMSDVLRVVGARVQGGAHELRINTTNVDHLEAPYELVRTMRASVYVLGPLLARYGRARVSLPGGCAWGPRPVDLHIKGMEALGAQVTVTHGFIEATAPNGLVGGKFYFPVSSVGATANVLMAAVLAKGQTVLDNAAVEPEIDSLVDYLQSMGAKIEGKGTRTLRIEGVSQLQPGHGDTIPDRIEAGTFLAAGVITKGCVKVTRVQPEHIQSILDVFAEMGVQVTQGEDWVQVDARGVELQPVDIQTLPYPGFPTDMQAQLMAILSTVKGRSHIQETIYLDRFSHVAELDRLGAEIVLQDSTAKIKGVQSLTAAPVMATDLRASAALVLAGLVAQGHTEISRIYHIDRGYEQFEDKFATLGAKVERFRTEDMY